MTTKPMSKYRFEQVWKHQQGALFLKSENSSLEWKNNLAEFFYREGFDEAKKRIENLEAENCNLKSIIAKELSCNDDFCSEFVIASILRAENAKLREALNAVQKQGLCHYSDCTNCDYEDNNCDCGAEKTELIVKNALEECESGKW
jgi:hypothetical protein